MAARPSTRRPAAEDSRGCYGTPMNRSSFVLLGSVLLSACGGPSTPAQSSNYDVRARVVEVHGSGDDLRVTLAHEAIPEFEDRSGDVVGMQAMAMAFGVARGIDAEAFSPGSKWQISFEVVWNREPPLRITRAERLPAETQLVLPAAQAP